MHMADALISPATGGVMWAISAGGIAFCSARVKKELDSSRVPLMGVLGAFIFAAQMINFTIPATGSSGHLGGGMILSILLGPYAAFLTIASVLVVQALFFADGGLLALGCNIFNLGAFPAFIAYPLIYKPLTGDRPTHLKIAIASIIAAITGLQMGSFAVVLETVASGISSLPFSTFVTLMQPIHLGIGIIEGVVTAAVISFVYKARPEIILMEQPSEATQGVALKNLLLGFIAASLLTGGVVSWYASENPDGLEWAIMKTTGHQELEEGKADVHSTLTTLQKKLAFLPGYSFRRTANVLPQNPTTPGKVEQNMETGVSGITGGGITLLLVFFIGYFLKKRSQVTSPQGR